MTGIVIIGAGQGAGQAAANFRQAGYEGELMILGEEPFPPYQRPPLSKQYLSGEMPLEKIFVRAEKFYADQNIELRTNTRVISIDPDSKTIETASGEKIGYEKLLIATGSRPRTLDVEGSELTGIHYLRTLSDVDAIRDAMTTAANLVIVGGGYIGLEFASVAVAAGLNVTLVEMEQRILQRVTTEEMSDYYHRLHTERGLNILTNTTVSGFTGYDHVSKVHCSDSSIDADLVIVGIGILPNIELAEDAGIECDNGILVDTHCRTSVEDVYAIGDCTNHQNSLLNRRLRLESVPNAMEAARVAVSNMLGVEKDYSAVPWFWSDQYDLKLQMVGFSSEGDTQILRGDKEKNQFAVFYLKDGAVVAVDAVNSPREFIVCKQLYGKTVSPDRLADLETDLKSLLTQV